MINRIENTKGIESRLMLLEQFEKTQITLENKSNIDQWINVWGANQGITPTNTSSSLSTQSYPQAVCYNSYNKYLYVVNQLSGTVQVFNEEQEELKSIKLEEQVISTTSPVAITFNRTTGNVYVIGLLSDKLYIISSALLVSETVNLSNRPIAISYNEHNESIYIQHLNSTVITAVDTVNGYLVELIETEISILKIATSSMNGDWAILASNGSTIKTFDRENNLSKNYDLPNSTINGISYLTNSPDLVIIDQESDLIQIIESDTGSVLNELAIEKISKNFKVFDKDIIVIELENPSQVILLNRQLQVTETIPIGFTPSDFTYDVESKDFYAVELLKSTVVIIGSGDDLQVEYSENYAEVLADFQHKPILIKHLKVNYSNQNNRPFFRIGYKSSAGKRESQLISLLKYHSPQHFGRIYEVTQLKDKMIDGRAFWEVLVPPKVIVSLLIYHT